MSHDGQADRKTESGEIARLLSYAVLLAVSVGLFWEASTIPTSRFEVLGAGAFPMLVHGVLILLLLSAIIGSLRQLPRHAYARFASDFGDWAKARRLVFVLFLCLGLYLSALPIVGYPAATFVFLAVLQLWFAPKTKTAAIIVLFLAIVFSLGLNWLFAEVFNVFLPRGS
ncbi:tripartite tricarboxylate transporter TctB family protein [Tranquillimonas alkanivorans]|uniref:Tripartite tricarboxylate transporter TctB family protein n=1 Tax=Tranquillimonas alkanivorans TaxID=441119 RepID=A0A1I5Q5J9_9RHOB|nr:tripartite tricarboxylate transporter TctB family protein [Tranquillimonas alkanivorans]SFP41573.1 Tripartite tricarboxylate transporter TctB family protein [Tranquillimonas alkanivorans]